MKLLSKLKWGMSNEPVFVGEPKKAKLHNAFVTVHFFEPFPNVPHVDIGVPPKHDVPPNQLFHAPGFELWYPANSEHGRTVIQELLPYWGYRHEVKHRIV